MKNYFLNLSEIVRRALFVDKIDLWLFLSALALSGLNVLIWKLKLSEINGGFIWRLNISPLSFLSIVLAINVFLALFAFDKEKEISYLLIGGALIAAFFTLILELFYLINL